MMYITPKIDLERINLFENKIEDVIRDVVKIFKVFSEEVEEKGLPVEVIERLYFKLPFGYPFDFLYKRIIKLFTEIYSDKDISFNMDLGIILSHYHSVSHTRFFRDTYNIDENHIMTVIESDLDNIGYFDIIGTKDLFTTDLATDECFLKLKNRVKNAYIGGWGKSKIFSRYSNISTAYFLVESKSSEFNDMLFDLYTKIEKTMEKYEK